MTEPEIDLLTRPRKDLISLRISARGVFQLIQKLLRGLETRSEGLNRACLEDGDPDDRDLFQAIRIEVEAGWRMLKAVSQNLDHDVLRKLDELDLDPPPQEPAAPPEEDETPLHLPGKILDLAPGERP